MIELLSNWIDWLPQLWRGLKVSLQLTGLAMLFGLPLGLLLALMTSSKAPWLRWPAIVLVEIGRGAPALVVLQMVYYGLPSAGINVSAFVSGSTALALTAAAYTSEILRAGINAVPKGEVEAGTALGMTKADILRFVVIPQGVMYAVPALMGFAILLFQTTALTFTTPFRSCWRALTASVQRPTFTSMYWFWPGCSISPSPSPSAGSSNTPSAVSAAI